MYSVVESYHYLAAFEVQQSLLKLLAIWKIYKFVMSLRTYISEFSLFFLAIFVLFLSTLTGGKIKLVRPHKLLSIFYLLSVVYQLPNGSQLHREEGR